MSRIVEQCRDVLSRHRALNPREYVSDTRFRALVLEMLEADPPPLSHTPACVRVGV